MPVAGAAALDRDPILQSRFAHQLPEDTFGGGRAADVAEADEADGDRSGRWHRREYSKPRGRVASTAGREARPPNHERQPSRSTRAGSIRAMRRAGIHPAMTPTAASSSAA